MSSFAKTNNLSKTQNTKLLYGEILLPPPCKINFINMQRYNDHMRLIYINMRNIYIDMQHDYVNMQDNYVYMRLN